MAQESEVSGELKRNRVTESRYPPTAVRTLAVGQDDFKNFEVPLFFEDSMSEQDSRQNAVRSIRR